MTEAERIVARRAARKRWRDKNKAVAHALSIAWQKKNKSRVNARYRARYAANPEFYRAKLRDKRNRNRDAFNKWSREWKAKQGDKYRARRVAYQAKRGCLLSGARADNISELVLRIRSAKKIPCYYCKTIIAGRDAHIEHIVPISAGGSNSSENICASCATCNLRKATKTPGQWQPSSQFLFSL